MIYGRDQLFRPRGRKTETANVNTEEEVEDEEQEETRTPDTFAAEARRGSGGTKKRRHQTRTGGARTGRC